MSLKSELATDKRFTQLKSLCQGITTSVNLEALLGEAGGMHSRRKSRKLHEVALKPTSVWEAIAADLASRARLIEIQVSLQRQAQALDIAITQVRAYIQVEYQDAIAEEGRTAGERKGVVDAALSPAIKQLESIQGAVDVLKLYVQDIDQCAFGLRNAIEVLKLQIERPNQVV